VQRRRRCRAKGPRELIVTTSVLASYQALLDLAEGQRRALLESNFDQFFALESKREQVFESLQALELEPTTASPQTQTQVRDLIAQILGVDQELEAALREHQEHTNHEIAKLQPGMNALHAYIQDHAESSFFFDKSQ
jgi:uncharacterized protein YPO0396